MPDIHETYEAKKNRLLASQNRRIRKVYDDAIREIEVVLRSVKYNGRKFNLSDYPTLKKKIDTITAGMHADMYVLQLNGIKDAWDLSNKKNDTIVDRRLSGKQIPKKVRQVLYDPNAEGLQKFIDRKDKGLDLSDRVWRTLDPFGKELEQAIGIGLGVGNSAAEISRDIRKYLVEPDRLFRRVRGEDGKLHLSANARNYHPGQGVYRSSYKNSMRVSRSETNMAYRSADHERWQAMPFVIGIEVKLSNAHPKYDICDSLTGQYPKDFKFVGWHPQCLCYQVPKMVSDEEFEKMEDQVLAGEEIDVKVKGQVTGVPEGFTKWNEDNAERVAGWKNKPYWMRDNVAYL